MASAERASFLMSSLGLRQSRLEPAMSDDEYVAWGKSGNQSEFSQPQNAEIVRLLEDEEALEGVLEVPFALTHLRDVHAVMKLAVAVAAERREDHVRHALFHPAFAGFALGFANGLVIAHRAKHAGLRGAIGKLSRKQQEAGREWGVAVATCYLTFVEANGIFGKVADLELYGIEDKWRLLGDERRWLCFDRVLDATAEGRRAAHLWFTDESADVPPHFLDALANLVAVYPQRKFE